MYIVPTCCDMPCESGLWSGQDIAPTVTQHHGALFSAIAHAQFELRYTAQVPELCRSPEQGISLVSQSKPLS